MKYLKIHKLVWAILVIAFTSIDGLLVLIVYLLYTVWNLKTPKGIWKKFHTGSDVDARWSGEAYSDDNIWETIKRRYHALIK